MNCWFMQKHDLPNLQVAILKFNSSEIVEGKRSCPVLELASRVLGCWVLRRKMLLFASDQKTVRSPRWINQCRQEDCFQYHSGIGIVIWQKCNRHANGDCRTGCIIPGANQHPQPTSANRSDFCRLKFAGGRGQIMARYSKCSAARSIIARAATNAAVRQRCGWWKSNPFFGGCCRRIECWRNQTLHAISWAASAILMNI